MKLKVYRCRFEAPLALFCAAVCIWTGCLSPEKPREKKAAPPPVHCAVIEKIVAGSSLTRAALQSGDAVVAWERTADPARKRPEARGRIGSVLDWMELEAEQAPLGPIRLTVWRQGRELKALVPQGLWDAGVRPWMPAPVLALYQQGKERVEAGDVPTGVPLWEQASRQGGDEAWLLRFWLNLRRSEAWLQVQRPADAEKVCRKALDEATARRVPLAQIAALNSLAKIAESTQNEKAGIAALLKVKRLQESLHGRSPGAAKVLHALGRYSILFGRLDKAEAYTRQSLAIFSEIAPESLEVASNLINLGFVADERGDLAEAERLDRQALARVRQLAPGSDREVKALNNLATELSAR